MSNLPPYTESMISDAIEKLKSKQQDEQYNSKLNQQKIKYCIEILKILDLKDHSKDDNIYQKICKYTKKLQYVEKFYDQLNNKFNLDRALYVLTACLIEYRLFLNRSNYSTQEIDYLCSFETQDAKIPFMTTKWGVEILENNLLELSPYDFYLFKSLFSSFPSEIINFYLGLPDYQALINHKETITSSEKTKQNLQEEVKKANDSIEKIDNLNNKLEELEKGYNFVGLSHGFENLLTEKKKSIYRSIGLLYVLGFLIILFPITKIFDVSIIHKSQENTLTSPHLIQVHNYTTDSNHSEQSNNINWTEILAGIALEFLLIYFFRVALNQYQITKTQIMQLELRRSLCQFIQSYAEYAQEIKEKDANALEKFENIIFSSILSHDANIPGTFDGMEHITSLIKELKGNK